MADQVYCAMLIGRRGWGAQVKLRYRLPDQRAAAHAAIELASGIPGADNEKLIELAQAGSGRRRGALRAVLGIVRDVRDNLFVSIEELAGDQRATPVDDVSELICGGPDDVDEKNYEHG